jgi:hypothetical protein
MGRFLSLLGVLAMLSACAVPSPDDASVEDTIAAAYVPRDAPKLTLVTVVNNKTGAGGHSALIVTGSQQVIFDPAGSFRHPDVAARRDVLYGMSPRWIAAYKSAHARNTYHVVTQQLPVTSAQTERALQLVQANGPVPSAFCANATSSLLRQVPGYERITPTFSPVTLMEQVEEIEGVVTERYYEDDEGNVTDGIRVAAQ